MSYDFQIVRKGYNPDEVDNYIEELEKQLSEYQEKSSTINKAIINAQIAADNIIKAAHSETDKILSQARKDADELKQATINQIKYLKLNIANQKNLINNFKNDYEFLTEKYLSPLITADADKVFDRLTEIEEAIDEISNSENAATIQSEKKPYRKEKRRPKKEYSKLESLYIPDEDITDNTQINPSTSLTLEEQKELLS